MVEYKKWNDQVSHNDLLKYLSRNGVSNENQLSLRVPILYCEMRNMILFYFEKWLIVNTFLLSYRLLL